jgi:hypothetical protein
MKTLNFKKQILNILTESFTKNDKSKMVSVLKMLKENKKLKDLYLFYEDVEKKYFDDKQMAMTYVNQLSEQLKGEDDIFRGKSGKKIYDLLSENVEEYDVENSELYQHLDTLLEADNFRNIDKKLLAKKYLVEFLTTKKEIDEDGDVESTINENMLNTVLTSNFNNYFNATLTEEEKSELKTILTISTEELNENFKTLKEEITSKVGKLINESNGELKDKLELTNQELNQMKPNKYNYYKLNQLKNGL